MMMISNMPLDLPFKNNYLIEAFQSTMVKIRTIVNGHIVGLTIKCELSLRDTVGMATNDATKIEWVFIITT